MKDLDTFRYDSLRLLKSEEVMPLAPGAALLAQDRVYMKDEDDEDGFFSARATHYRERLQAKRGSLRVWL